MWPALIILISLPVYGAERSQSVRREFVREHPCPIVVDGKCQAEVDHMKSLCSGGSDTVENLQWLSKEQHRLKTLMDIKECALMRAKDAQQDE